MILLQVATNTTTSSGGGISPELFALTVSAIVGACVAVFATFAVQFYFDRPKVKGSVITLITFSLAASFPDVRGRLETTVVLPYVLVTNQHRNPISLTHFLIDVDYGTGWRTLEHVNDPETFFTNPAAQPQFVINQGDRILRFPSGDKALLERKLKPIRFGEYSDGFLAFATRGEKFLGKDIKHLRITCVDVFQNKHVIHYPKPRSLWSRLMRKKGQAFEVPSYFFERNAGASSEFRKV